MPGVENRSRTGRTRPAYRLRKWASYAVLADSPRTRRLWPAKQSSQPFSSSQLLAIPFGIQAKGHPSTSPRWLAASASDTTAPLGGSVGESQSACRQTLRTLSDLKQLSEDLNV